MSFQRVQAGALRQPTRRRLVLLGPCPDHARDVPPGGFVAGHQPTEATRPLPLLPIELKLTIFEYAASINSQTALNIALVAHWTTEVALQEIYRRVVLQSTSQYLRFSYLCKAARWREVDHRTASRQELFDKLRWFQESSSWGEWCQFLEDGDRQRRRERAFRVRARKLLDLVEELVLLPVRKGEVLIPHNTPILHMLRDIFATSVPKKGLVSIPFNNFYTGGIVWAGGLVAESTADSFAAAERWRGPAFITLAGPVYDLHPWTRDMTHLHLAVMSWPCTTRSMFFYPTKLTHLAFGDAFAFSNRQSLQGVMDMVVTSATILLTDRRMFARRLRVLLFTFPRDAFYLKADPARIVALDSALRSALRETRGTLEIRYVELPCAREDILTWTAQEDVEAIWRLPTAPFIQAALNSAHAA